MALAGVLGSSLGLRILRSTGTRLSPHLVYYTRSNARSFAILNQNTRLRGILPTLVVSSRSYTTPTSASSAQVTSADEVPLQETASSSTGVALDHVAPVMDLPADSSATDLVPNIVESAMSSLPPVLQYGDLAALGLVSWTPAGLIRWTFELINVTTGLPWFWTIVAGSILWKVALLPLSVQGLRNSARLLPIQPQIKELQDEMGKIRVSGDKLALQRNALKMRKIYKDAGVSLGMGALVPVIQIPVTLGMFFGVKGMCTLPVVQMASSGLSILPDLTVPDPYMVLPILLCAAVNVQISAGAAELNLTERPEMGHVMNGLRLLSLAGVWVMTAFPSGLLVALVTTSFATTIQTFALQYPPIRKALDIPAIPHDLRGSLPSMKASLSYVIERWQSKVEAAKIEAKQQRRRR